MIVLASISALIKFSTTWGFFWIKDSALMKGLEGKAIRLKSKSTLIPSP